MSTRHITLLLLAAIVSLGGCAGTTPALDARFGESLATLKTRQSRDPGAALANANRPVDGIEGPAASNGMDRYYKSFARPAAPMNIINVGVPVGNAASASH